MQSKSPRIAIVDDHPLFGQTLKIWTEKFTESKVIGVYTRSQLLLNSINKTKPDFIFLDIQMPGMGGLETAQKIMELSPTSKIVVITMFDDPWTIKNMLKLNVAGYITKDIEPDHLITAIKKIFAGECYITEKAAMNVTLQNMSDNIYVNGTSKEKNEPVKQKEKGTGNLSTKEKQVVKLIVQGLSDKKIADKLFISSRTVAWHKTNIMKKMGVKKSTEIVAYAYDMKLI